MNVAHPVVGQLLAQHEALKTLDHSGRQAFMLAVDAMAPIPVGAALLAMGQLASTASHALKSDVGDVAYLGPRDAAGVRFVARVMAISKMGFAGGPVPEPSEEQIAAEVSAATRIVLDDQN